jgi:integrase
VRGKAHYFGPWSDPQAALQKWLDQKDDLLAGRTPRVITDGLTVRELCNRFLTSKRLLLDNSELTARTFRDYYDSCSRIVNQFSANRVVDDLAADDFESFRSTLARTRGPVALGNEIQRVRSVFKYAYDQALIDKPIRYGQGFKKPSRKVLRIARNGNGQRMFEAEELRSIIDAANEPLRTMILLGINAGFGQSDVGALTVDAVDGDWLIFPRPKTGVERRIPLWKETAAALSVAIESRKAHKDDADQKILFITKYGRRWSRTTQSGAPVDAVGQEFTKLLRRLEIKREKIGFYALRHTFATIAGESRDQVAVNAIMGHVDNSMAGAYRERISDSRLIAVTAVVRAWLFPEHNEHEDGGEE